MKEGNEIMFYGRSITLTSNLFELPVESREIGTYVGSMSNRILKYNINRITGKGITFAMKNNIGVTTIVHSTTL